MFASTLSRSLFPRATISPARTTLFSLAKRFNSTDLKAANSLITSSTPFKFSNGPVVTKYTPDHEWVSLHPDGTAFIGITKYAADALGDCTFVELPAVGDIVEKADSVGSVESVKSASEVFTPVSGEVTSVNESVVDTPTLLNEQPMGEAWLVQIKVADVESDFKNNDELMDLDAYVTSLEEDH